MKAGWYICDGTSQFPYRNIQSIQKPFFQTWTKWINILVNKYISDMSLYWNVLLYIKYNTNTFLFCCSHFYKQSIQNILIYPLKFWRDFFFFFTLLEKAVSARNPLQNKTKTNTNNTKRKVEQDEITPDDLWCLWMLLSHVDGFGLVSINTMSLICVCFCLVFFFLYKTCLSQSAAYNSVIFKPVPGTVWAE